MSGPDLHVFTLKKKFTCSGSNFFSFNFLYYATFQCFQNNFKIFFGLEKAHNRPNPFFHSPAQTTAHSPELIFQIMKSWEQTSVLLSVI